MSVTQLPERTTYAPPDSEHTAVASPQPGPGPQHSRAERWSIAQRIGFRFAFTYFGLYLFPFPLDSLPVVGRAFAWVNGAENWVSRWTEVHLFGLDAPLPIVPSGSGDTMARWALQAAWLLIALGVTLLWTVLDRRRRNYARLNQWLHVYVRFALATIMLGYGIAKVIPTQMPTPQLERLVQPWGEFSPMGVLWSFMGYSSVYQIFTGIGEALGALLLVFRRTVTLGALLLIGVLANVVLLNYTFDVPVKLYSTNLLLMAVFLAAPDLKRLLNVLVLNRVATPRADYPLFATRTLNRVAAAVGLTFIAFIVWRNTRFTLEYYRQSIAPSAPKSPVYGIWDVDALTKNGVAQPPLLSDSTRLKRVVFGGLNRAMFRLMSDSVERYSLKVDSAKRELTLTGRFDPKLVRTFTYVRPDSQHLVLMGQANGDSLVVRLRRLDERRFVLVSRGFNWIQELPFNR